MRYFVEFAYNGSHFHGSQRQPNAVSVQETMENAFTLVLRQPVSLTFAGRTDAGVHAEQMFAHFEITDDGLPVIGYGLRERLNSLLPASIAIRQIFPVSDDAHARFSAIARTYEYRITTTKDPFKPLLATRVAPGLDFAAMNKAATLLLGKHDFASFCKVHTDVKTTFCTISRAEWRYPTSNSASGPTSDSEAVFTISADRFLRNMVRAVVGTLFEVGRGKLTLEGFRQVIEAQNRCAAGQSVPPQGLFLTHIQYPFDLPTLGDCENDK